MTKMLALTAAFLTFAVAANAAVPDPTRSTVAPCFATCPAGDLAFSVVVRDFADRAITGSSVVIDFSFCPTVNICSNQDPGTTVLSGNKVLRATDSTGTVIFLLRAGGLCPGSGVQIYADGVLLATRSVASADQNGDLAVTLADETIASPKVGGHDPGADLDCDGSVTVNDMSIIDSHLNHVCAAPPIPPPNDNFGNATTIDLNTLPFSGTVDVTHATLEPGEPQPCGYSYQTIWYKFTATTGVWLQLDTQGSSFPYGANLNVFRDTGTGLSGLAFLGCANYGSLTFLARVDSTGPRSYYVQGQAPCCGVSGNLQVNLRQIAPPAPQPSFSFYPGDPSVFDSLQFYDQSSDPGQVGFQTRAWDFGDGTSKTLMDSGVLHGYAADGDYTVRLTVTTFDGRSASTSQVVHVRTHDVAIVRFKTPQSGSVGQTRPITVGIKNTRYPETVHIELSKSVPGGYPYGSWQVFGTSDQSVPVRNSNHTTDIDFSYTFSGDDAVLGKVSFRAVATLVGARDALPADNEAISSPVKISRFGSFFQYQGENAVLALLGVTPNPAQTGTDLLVRLSLPAAAAATLQLIDVAGRVLADRELGSLGPGIHEVHIAPEGRAAPGILWVRLTQGGKAVLTKAVILQ